MEYKAVLKIMKHKNKKEKKIEGFMVHFEWVSGSIRTGDWFPSKHQGEKLIKTEEMAWKLANRFAEATSSDIIRNIYVVNQDFIPVPGFVSKTLKPDRMFKCKS